MKSSQFLSVRGTAGLMLTSAADTCGWLLPAGLWDGGWAC